MHRNFFSATDLRSDVLKRHYSSCTKATQACSIDDSGAAELDSSLEASLQADDPALDLSPSISSKCTALEPQWIASTTQHLLCLESDLATSTFFLLEPTVNFNFLQRFTRGLPLHRAFSAEGADQLRPLYQHEDAALLCACKAVSFLNPGKCQMCTPLGLFLLSEKADQIVDDLSSHVLTEGRFAAVKQMFTASNLLRIIGYYWRDWHANLPIVHPHVFNFESAPCPLVVAMAMMGACHSPDAHEKAEFKLHYDAVERYVFANIESFRGRTLEGTAVRELVQVLQAAYLILICQSWDGSQSARLGVRRKRFAQMVEVIHALGVSSATHRDYRQIALDDFDWLAFVEMEELIR